METASDVLVATMLGFSIKAKNVGAMTSIDESEGKSLISSEGKVTDERLFASGKQFYFHEHRPTAKTGSEWNLKDELEREYLTSGNQTVTFTPSGWQTNAQKLDTEGDYVWRQETIDPSGPYAGAPVRHWGTSNYNSNGFVTQTSLPSGSMSATFDEDGKVVSASGSVIQVNEFSGRAFSHLDGTGHGAKGGEGAAVLVAKREVSRDRLGEFQGSSTQSVSPIVNTNSATGETALAFNESDPVITGTKYGYQNEMDKRSVYQIFHGTVTGDNNSFTVTDSGDLPDGASSSTNVLLPETDFGDDSSYGNPIADLAPWGGFDVPFTTNGTWSGGTGSGGSGGSGGGGSGTGPQPGDSPLILGTGNSLDLGLFSSAYGYEGETVGASFAWQLPNTGTPTDPTSFGDAVFNSGNFQSPQEPGGGSDENYAKLVLEILNTKYGLTNPLVNGFHLSGGTVEFKDYWFLSQYFGQRQLEGTSYVPFVQLDRSVFNNPFEAADVLYGLLKKNEFQFAKHVYDSDPLRQLNRVMDQADDHAVELAEEVFRIGMGACDAGEIIMAMNDLADSKISAKQKLLIAVLVALPIVNARYTRATDFVDNNGHVVQSKLDDALSLVAPIRGIAGTRGLQHSFDRHAAEWFARHGGTPSLAKWQELLETAARSSKVVDWSTGADKTIGHLARIDGNKWFFVQFFKEGPRAGEVATAFIPNKDQLRAILELLGK